ncbi:nucleoside triphosphate pyrophosphohydrolase family protein [Kitasatospora sp. NPDC057965]|uniref:nucleoside triphosphate pyrophosphohydrolase family protein n=1 Tax=Kitasatospora sp. NPDC057965 TaxID=3346291 RepID=UPI0036DE1587
MDISAYQKVAVKTLQQPVDGVDPAVVCLLGLTGEVGSLTAAYKKHLRDGPGLGTGKQLLREEMGDILWYLGALAHCFDLDLGDIAAASLEKTKDRWLTTPSGEREVLDAGHLDAERLPRQASLVFSLQARESDGRETAVLTYEGDPCGDPLTDASHVDDDYRFHDAFHLAYAAVLGWSPVTRFLLKRKRRSDARTDEAEDGGRAIAIEEGISALVFSYAAQHGFFEQIDRVDNELLRTIQGMTAHLEVGAHRAADWEKAILTGYSVWRQLRKEGGGVIDLDLDQQSMTVRAPSA